MHPELPKVLNSDFSRFQSADPEIQARINFDSFERLERKQPVLHEMIVQAMIRCEELKQPIDPKKVAHFVAHMCTLCISGLNEAHRRTVEEDVPKQEDNTMANLTAERIMRHVLRDLR